MRIPYPPSYISWRICGVMSDPRSVERLDAKDFMDEREYGKIDAIGPHNSCQTKCEESRTDECTQFDEYLVFVGKQLLYTMKKGGGVMIHRSVVGKRRWLMECAFSMKHGNQIVYIDTATLSRKCCAASITEMRRHTNQQSDTNIHTTVGGRILMIYTHNRLTIDTRVQRNYIYAIIIVLVLL